MALLLITSITQVWWQSLELCLSPFGTQTPQELNKPWILLSAQAKGQDRGLALPPHPPMLPSSPVKWHSREAKSLGMQRCLEALYS